MAKKIGMIVATFILLQFSFQFLFASASDFNNKTAEKKVEISPQVTHIEQKYQASSTNQVVNILDVNLNNTYTELELGLPNPQNSLKTTSSLAKLYNTVGHRVVGAVNASYFLGNGVPANLLAQNNEIINYGILGEGTESPTQNPIAFGISKSGKAMIDYYTTDISFTVNGKEYDIDLIDSARTANNTVLYTSDRKATGTNQWGAEIVVESATQNTAELHFGDQFSGVVSNVTKFNTPGNSSVPADGFVISVQNKDLANELTSSIEAGAAVEVNLSIDPKWMDAEYIIAAGPLLVKDNKANITMSNSSLFASSRSPRTAVAVDATGKRVFLVTVDGRQNGYSNGTNLSNLASYLISLGASSAINLDGGGSTTMVVREPGGLEPRLVNRPSDGSERKVSAILQVVNTAPQGKLKAMTLGNIPGEVAKGSTVSLSVKSAYDEFLNPMDIKPADVKWSVEGNIGTINGTTFTATGSGQGKIIARYDGVTVSKPLSVKADVQQPQQPGTSYTDVQPTHWAYTAIDSLNKQGLIKGYQDGTFRPSNPITRAEAAVIIARELKLTTSKASSFTDVSKTHYAYQAIAAVEEKGIINGRSKGKFDPNGKLTRAEMAAILTRAYELTGSSKLPFTDVQPTHWAYSDIQTLYANDLAGGFANNTFKPNDNINRAQFATFMYRIMNQK